MHASPFNNRTYFLSLGASSSRHCCRPAATCLRELQAASIVTPADDIVSLVFWTERWRASVDTPQELPSTCDTQVRFLLTCCGYTTNTICCGQASSADDCHESRLPITCNANGNSSFCSALGPGCSSMIEYLEMSQLVELPLIKKDSAGAGRGCVLSGTACGREQCDGGDRRRNVGRSCQNMHGIQRASLCP